MTSFSSRATSLIRALQAGFAMVACSILFLSASMMTLRSDAASSSSLAGAYQCWKFNTGMSTITQVGQSIAKCTSPDLVLQEDGSYALGSEKGRFTISGNQITLSASKFRGKGTLMEQDLQIHFVYDYNGKHYEVTYLKRDPGPAEPMDPVMEKGITGNTLISVDLTLLFPPEDKSVAWVNTVTLLTPQGEFGAEALAVTDGVSKVTAYFRAVRTGKIYTVNIGSGFDAREVGKLDLQKTTGRVVRTIRVSSVKKTTSPKTSVKKSKKVKTTRFSSSSSSQASSASSPARSGAPCDPLIPRYAQPECSD